MEKLYWIYHGETLFFLDDDGWKAVIGKHSHGEPLSLNMAMRIVQHHCHEENLEEEEMPAYALLA